MPPKPAVITAVSFDYAEPDYSSAAERVRDYAREHGLRLQGGGFIRLLSATAGTGPVRVCGLLSAPIYGDEKKYGTMK